MAIIVDNEELPIYTAVLELLILTSNDMLRIELMKAAQENPAELAATKLVHNDNDLHNLITYIYKATDSIIKCIKVYRKCKPDTNLTTAKTAVEEILDIIK